MKQQKIVVQFARNLNIVIDPLLIDGWRVILMTNESVSKGGATSGSSDNGRIIVILEK